MTMQPIPSPHILDTDRILDNDRGDFTVDHEARAQLLGKGFREASAYAQQLWNTLAAARTYLWDSLPSDPRSPGPHPRVSAAPTGPDDSDGWDQWIDAYGGITSVLCGPHGDSGFGVGEARETARFRRDAPNVRIAAQHPDLETASQPGRAPGGAQHRDSEPAPSPTHDPSQPTRKRSQHPSTMRTAVLVAAGVLAGRLLAPRDRITR